jgi:hypothetical protein
MKVLITDAVKRNKTVLEKIERIEDKIKLILATDKAVIQRNSIQNKFVDDSFGKIQTLKKDIDEYRRKILSMLDSENLGIIEGLIMYAKNVEGDLKKKGEQFASIIYGDFQRLKELEESSVHLQTKLKINN